MRGETGVTNQGMTDVTIEAGGLTAVTNGPGDTDVAGDTDATGVQRC